MNETTSATSPESRRRLLRSELVRLRKEIGLTQQQVADQMEWSTSKLIRIEGGHASITLVDLDALLRIYGVTSESQRTRLRAIAREARKPSSWSQYRDVLTATQIEYLGSEQAAAFIRLFDPLIIPSLLQTEEYARALLQQSYRFSPTVVERRIELQLQRQEQLDRADPPRLYVVLDEPAVRRLVGGRTVMRRQLSRLLDIVRRSDRITVRIMPLTAGATPAVFGGFGLLEFDGGLPDILQIEAVLLEDDERVAYHRDTFEELLAFAYTVDESAAFIEVLIDELVSDAEPELIDELEQHFVL